MIRHSHSTTHLHRCTAMIKHAAEMIKCGNNLHGDTISVLIVLGFSLV